MINWWNGLSLISQIFAAVAIPATVIMVVQALLLLIGVGMSHGDADGGLGDAHGDGGVGDGHFDGDHFDGDHFDGDHFDGDHFDGAGHFDGGADSDPDTDLGGDHFDGDHIDDGHLGAGHVHGHAHGSGSGLSLFSVRGIVSFFSIGGWIGVVCDTAGLGLIPSVFLSLAAGFAALYGIALFFQQAMKLQSSGNLDIHNAVGKTASVYIPIPPKGTGRGKITVLVQDRLVELEAVNADAVQIPTGALVSVVSAIDPQTVTVKSEQNIKSEGGISKWVLN